MMILYFVLLAALAVVQLLLRWRAAGLERRYLRLATEADALVKAANTRGGNTNKPDPCQSARQQYQLAMLAMRRDRVEKKHAWWEAAAARLGQWRRGLLGYKGRLVPYLMGTLDLAGVAVLLSWLGMVPAPVKALFGVG
jgi:hypothetical protein